MPPPSMQEFFTVQSDLRKSRGLERIIVEHCPTYKPNGLKSYVFLLHRFGFNPTQPGPYERHERKQVEQRGLLGGAAALGGRARLVDTHMLLKTDDKGNLGEVPAEDQQWDSMYLCPVQIGTPAQTLMLDFDTGSADLWVFSTELPASLQKGHTCFDPKKSKTYKDLTGLSWSITYGDRSSASGNCGSDTVGLGGLLVENQCVELAVKLSTQFAQGSGDGLLGLAFSTINTVTQSGRPDPQKTVVENMIDQKDIPPSAEVFTSAFYSTRNNPPKDSFFTFGWIDQELVKASGTDIKWTPIDNSSGFWMFPSTTFSVNGKKYTQAGNRAIADTGTTLALVTDTVCKALYAAIPGAKYDRSQQGWVFPLKNTAEQMPEFALAVGEYDFVIQPQDLAFAPVDNTYWYGAVQSRGDNPFDILGDAFLKSIYAIWDQGNLRFGAVPKIEKTQTMTPPAGSM